MSLQIKSLVTLNAMLKPAEDTAAMEGSSNLIPADAPTKFYTLYQAANTTGNTKSAIVKGIRLFNNHTDAVNVSLYVNSSTDAAKFSRYPLLPEDTAIPAKSTLIDDTEITLGPGDRIQARASSANKIRFLISGVERDVV